MKFLQTFKAARGRQYNPGGQPMNLSGGGRGLTPGVFGGRGGGNAPNVRRGLGAAAMRRGVTANMAAANRRGAGAKTAAGGFGRVVRGFRRGAAVA